MLVPSLVSSVEVRVLATMGRRLADALRRNNTVAMRKFERNRIVNGGAAAFADALCLNATADILTFFEYNRISNVGAMALAEMLRRNSAITWLYLNSNRIYDKGIFAKVSR